MPSLKKKVTAGLKHRASSLIKLVTLPPGYNTAVILFAQKTAAGHTEQRLPVTNAFGARAISGAGTSHHSLSKGLAGISQFQFVLLTEEDPELGEVVCGCHCIPDSNYLGGKSVTTDFSNELKRPVSPDAAIVQIHEDSGEIDVAAFPSAFSQEVQSFVKKLEALEEIDHNTSFDVGGVHFSVRSIYGDEVTFSCRKKNG